METVSLLFIVVFILVQGALGILLLYRGFALALESFKVESLTAWMTVASGRLKAAISFLSWRRVALLVVLLVPGSILSLLVVALWGARLKSGHAWKVSAHRWHQQLGIQVAALRRARNNRRSTAQLSVR